MKGRSMLHAWSSYFRAFRIVGILFVFAATALAGTPQRIDRFGNPLYLVTDGETGSVLRIEGAKASVTSYGLQARSLTPETVRSLADRIFADYAGFLNLTVTQISVSRIETDGTYWFIHATQMQDGLPIEGTEIGFNIDGIGNIVGLGSHSFPHAVSQGNPLLTVQDAKNAALRKAAAPSAVVHGRDSLVVLPVRSSDGTWVLRPCWRLHVVSTSPLQSDIVFVDASNGSILATHGNLARRDKDLDIPLQNLESAFMLPSYEIHGQVKGSYYPVHNYDSPVQTGFRAYPITLYNSQGQYIAQTRTIEDTDGYYFLHFTTSYPGYSLHTSLQNDWASVYNGNQLVDEWFSFTAGSSVLHNVTWAAGDMSNVFWFINQMHDYIVGPPFNYSMMNYQSLARCSQGPLVAASTDGITSFFGSYNGQLWARSNDCVCHEYAHCVIYHVYGNQWIGDYHDITLESTAMDEGFADYFSGAINNKEISGEDVNDTRHLQNSLTKDDRTFSAWHDGQIIAGACWDIRQVLSGTDALVFRALRLSPQPRTWQDLANSVVKADDDDGNINNGTPHLETIRAKFYAKKIYFDAGPPQAPQSISIGLSNSRPRITWGAAHEPDVVSGGNTYVERRLKPKFYPWQSWTQIAQLSGTATEYIDQTVFACPGPCPDSVQYRVRAKDASANYSSYSNLVSITALLVKYGEQPSSESHPAKFELIGSNPNPFNPGTTIRYSLSAPAHVSLVVYNAIGQEVARLVHEQQNAGYYGVVFQGAQIASGVYYARITVRDENGLSLYDNTTKLILAK